MVVLAERRIAVHRGMEPLADDQFDPRLVEPGMQGKYQVTSGIALKLGYEVLWLSGVALAPGQIQETYTVAPATVYATGVNSRSNVLFHGVTAGLEVSF